MQVSSLSHSASPSSLWAAAVVHGGARPDGGVGRVVVCDQAVAQDARSGGGTGQAMACGQAAAWREASVASLLPWLQGRSGEVEFNPLRSCWDPVRRSLARWKIDPVGRSLDLTRSLDPVCSCCSGARWRHR